MIRSLLTSLRSLRRPQWGRGPRCLTPRQFHRRVERERLRQTRRASAFCIIVVSLTSDDALGWQNKQLALILLRYLRATDCIARMPSGETAVLLLDTQLMGGRAVIERLRALCHSLSLPVQMELEIPDEDQFGAVVLDSREPQRSLLQVSGVTGGASKSPPVTQGKHLPA